MKTLKIQLLAACLFTCTATFAQSIITPTLGPAVTPRALTPTPNTPVGSTGRTGAATSAAIAPTRASYQTGATNDANVQQSNNNQYANVNQTVGGTAGNTADIYQIGSSGNNATITQETSSQYVANRNTARIDQTGLASTADQNQLGGGNDAYAVQESGVGNGSGRNSSYQKQTGNNNYEYVNQNGNNNYANQIQRGDTNQAEIFQTGNNKTSIQSQDGGSNISLSTQTGATASYSLTAQQGGQNQAFVTQK